jgi:SAM-dependent methyltransferase
MTQIDRSVGQRAFGSDPAAYDRARPDYPPRVYEILCRRCGLGRGARIFEIGPGTGLATRHLFEAGADPLVVVEPDERLVEFLKAKFGKVAGLEVQLATFEDAVLPPGWFDLGVAATAFHWLDQASALGKVASLLRPGGWWAMWWNVFGDPSRRDDFHDATNSLLGNLETSPSGNAQGRPPSALDVDDRIADLQIIGAFHHIAHEAIRWTLTLNTTELTALYATFSPISSLPPAEQGHVLEGLAKIAERQFGGTVERPMVTSVYIAQRK